MLKIKVCGLTDPANIEQIAKTSPDFIGFNFYPKSKRYVGYNPKDSLFGTIPTPILKTGVFVNEEPSKIIDTTDLYLLDLVQLHGNESAEYCKNLVNRGLIIIKAFETSKSFSFSKLDEYMEVCEYFLFVSLLRLSKSMNTILINHFFWQEESDRRMLR